MAVEKSKIIVGRDKEKKELDSLYQSKQSELVAVYGRRRVGKTFLIRNHLKAKGGLYFQATGIRSGAAKAQLSQFSHELSCVFYHNIPIEAPKNWMDMFGLLTRAIKAQDNRKKIILFFDELPWLATQKSDLIAALEYYWNRYWVNDERIKLIICGSSASWIIKRVINNRGGLHNRVTRRIALKPFSLLETQKFLKNIGLNLNYEQTLSVFMVVGGIPFYLNQFKRSYSVNQNINRLLFNEDSLFFEEFNEVFASLFKNSEQYKEIIKIIAKHRYGLLRSEIESLSKLSGKGGTLTERLNDLEQTDFITSYIPFGKNKRGKAYRISDEYCYFYLNWVDPIRAQIKQDSHFNYWQMFMKKSKYYDWRGYMFENTCYKHLPPIKKTLGITGLTLVSPWQCHANQSGVKAGVQIDFLIDRDDDGISMCEIKCSDQPFVIDKSYAQQLSRKKKIFIQTTGTKKQVFITVISASGLKENFYSDELIDHVVTLRDLFQDV